MIEAIADVINITSKGGLNLSGNRFTLDSTNTKISADGVITCSNIEANSGTIGGFNITKDGLIAIPTSDQPNVKFALYNIKRMIDGSSTVPIIGMANGNKTTFLVRSDGSMTNAWINTGYIQTRNVPYQSSITMFDASNKKKVELSTAPGSGKLELFSSFGHVGVDIYGYANGIDSGFMEIWKNGSDRTILLDGYDGGGYFRKIEVQSARLGTTSFVGDGIEIYHTWPHIDFHKDNSGADYTSRLIEEVAGSLYLRATNGAWGWFHAGGYAQDSSKYVKKNIQDIPEDEALKLLQLRPVSFDYKNGDTNRRGLIAEEVMDVYPELVQIPDGYDEDTFEYDEEGPNIVPSLDYSSFVPYLIKMVQIQQKEIEDLKEQVSELSKRLV